MPITIAAGALSVSAIVIALIASALGDIDGSNGKIMLASVLIFGIGVFLFAMRWDSSDPARVTRRSDVAFWLHLLAAPMIIHPIFTLLASRHSATIAKGLSLRALVAIGLSRGPSTRALPRPAWLSSIPANECLAASDVELMSLAVGHRLVATAALGFLAPGPRHGRPAAAGQPQGAAAASGSRRQSRTSRISRRSSGARTKDRSWPRLSTAPCSDTSENAPCFK